MRIGFVTIPVLFVFLCSSILIPFASFSEATVDTTRGYIKDFGLGFVNDQDRQIASVYPGANTTVTFECYVDSEPFFQLDSEAENILFDLSCSSKMYWKTFLDLDTFNLTSVNKQYFTVTVTVPHETSVYILDSVIILAAITVLPDGNEFTSEIRGNIDIEEFYITEFETTDRVKKVIKGDTALFTISISNLGNAREIITASIKNINELAQVGFNVHLTSYTMELDEKSFKDLILMVETDSLRELGEHEIELELNSLRSRSNNRSYEPEVYKFKVEVKRDPVRIYSIIGVVALIVIIIAVVVKQRRKKSVGDNYGLSGP